MPMGALARTFSKRVGARASFSFPDALAFWSAAVLRRFCVAGSQRCLENELEPRPKSARRLADSKTPATYSSGGGGSAPESS